MTILGIETSCDETGAAIIKGTTKDKPVTLVSNTLATSLSLHAKTGGIIPEEAAREQLKVILPVIEETLKDIKKNDIDAIAVTHGPGLIGSLLVGIETAKTLSYLWDKPLIPVNHLFGHIYANFISDQDNLSTLPRFPSLALVVSGGHTDLVLLKENTDVLVIGSTRDDAAGEAFDKIGRLLGLSYPAGAKISEKAKYGNAANFPLPRPMKHSGDFDFSFSGLKTAVFNKVQTITNLTEEISNDVCASVEQAVVDVLVYKTLQAAQTYSVSSVLLGGGVSANTMLKTTLREELKKNYNLNLFVPKPKLCTDNAAMIAAAGFYRQQVVPINEITVDPDLYYTV